MYNHWVKTYIVNLENFITTISNAVLRINCYNNYLLQQKKNKKLSVNFQKFSLVKKNIGSEKKN